MMETTWMDSYGGGRLRVCRWIPTQEIRCVVQIVHGVAEHMARYDDFACWLNTRGIAVVGEDHMGHGGSASSGPIGYFRGGWFAAVQDTWKLLCRTREEFPDVPYILLGHSMGSFMARTILIQHPEAPISGCILSGTGWQPAPVLAAGLGLCRAVCSLTDETKPNTFLHKLVFGGYNAKIEHPRTSSDWLTRDTRCVDAYVADPMCGFPASAGLLRDMLTGIHYIQQRRNLCAMAKDLPVYFVSGSDDPVGAYGKGVRQTAQAFTSAGMTRVQAKLYPLCRHEVLNECNRMEVYEDMAAIMAEMMQ